MKSIHYIGYHTKDDNPNEYYCFPAPSNKIGYIITVLKNIDYYVNVLSLGESIVSHGSKKVIIDQQETINYVGTIGKANVLLKIGARLWLLFQILWYLLQKTDQKSTVMVYHTLETRNIIKLARFFKKFTLIYEIEEIFSAVYQKSDSQIKAELKSLSIADGYILVNDLLRDKFQIPILNSVVCYGEYTQLNNIRPAKQSSDIVLVYAGVIAGPGSDVYLSIDSMAYLPKNYILKIVGYGTENDLKNLRYYIAVCNKNLDGDRIFFDGKKTGLQYTDYLATCDIGLCTRVLADAYSDYTFPSKVMVYLNNGLKVISSKIKCIESSKVSEFIYFYEQSAPKAVAETVLKIDLNQNSNTSELDFLHNNFKIDLDNVLQQAKFKIN